jgi:hypothetical protein
VPPYRVRGFAVGDCIDTLLAGGRDVQADAGEPHRVIAAGHQQVEEAPLPCCW